MDDLKAFRVPVLILSGGEPLLRPDIFEISARAKAMRFYVGLSSNGALIDEADGRPDRRGRLRLRRASASTASAPSTTASAARRAPSTSSLRGMRLLRDRGIKVGLRFTVTERNVESLPAMLDLMEQEEHRQVLPLAPRLRRPRQPLPRRRRPPPHDARGHGPPVRALPAHVERRPRDRVRHRQQRRRRGLLPALGRAHFPERAGHIRAKLEAWGGNASGVNVANIDNLGNVHPDTFWWHYSLGNVKERPFGEIWQDLSDPIMAGSRPSPRRSRAAAAPAASSRSAAATRACARCGSPATPGPRTPPATSADAEIGAAGPRRGRGLPGSLRVAPSPAAPSASAAAAAGPSPCPLRRAMRRLPRRGPARRHGPGAAAGEPGPAQARPGAAGDRRRPRRDADAGLRPASSPEEIAALAAYRTPLPEVPAGARPRSRLAPHAGRPGERCPTGRSPRADPAEPVRRGRGRRPPRHHPGRRPVRAAHPLPQPLRAARRAQVQPRRALRPPHVARRLGHPLRPVEPAARGRGPGRDQQPQHRHLRRRPGDRRRQLPAAHPGPARRGDARAARGQARRRPLPQEDLARLRGLPGAPRQSFVVALKDLPEIWEVAYSRPAAAIFGFVHTYERAWRRAWPQGAVPGPPDRAERSRSTTSSSIPLTPT